MPEVTQHTTRSLAVAAYTNIFNACNFFFNVYLLVIWRITYHRSCRPTCSSYKIGIDNDLFPNSLQFQLCWLQPTASVLRWTVPFGTRKNPVIQISHHTGLLLYSVSLIMFDYCFSPKRLAFTCHFNKKSFSHDFQSFFTPLYISSCLLLSFLSFKDGKNVPFKALHYVKMVWILILWIKLVDNQQNFIY